MTTLPVKFAVCGAGHIGLRHAEMIQKHPHAKLSAIIDSNPHKEQLIQVQHPHVPFFQSYESFLSENPDADVMVIATPNGLHCTQALQAIHHGLHVVIEKPMGLNGHECKEVIVAANEYAREVFCVMQNRYSPPAQWLKKIMRNGLLGHIYMVQINCFWNRDERYYNRAGWHGKADQDGGTLFTQFSHFIDLMFWAFGDIDNITASFADFNHKHLTDFEDSGIINFNFVNGGLGTFSYSTSVWDKNLESSITVIGEKGSLKIAGQYMDKVEYCHIQGYEMEPIAPTNPPNSYGNYQGSAANHHYIIENVVNVLQGKTAITTNASEGLKVVEMIERIYQLKKTPKGG